MIQELYKQIHTYLSMEEEISFAEFDLYYKKVLAYFNECGNDFDEEQLWKGLFISETLVSNADARAGSEKGKQAKKFAKIAQRMALWAQNFTSRLMDKGYTEEELQQRFENMFDEDVE